MGKRRAGLLGLALAAWITASTPSQAQVAGTVKVTFAKAGLVVGAGGGRGVLTYRGRDYPFRISGVSVGVTIGASAMRLSGRAKNIRNVADFEGSYSAVGGGGALVGGVGVVQLTNGQGVMITLQGPKAGLEFASNISALRISFR